MFKYGKRSTRALNSCHPDLQYIMNEAIKWHDISIFEGHRGKNDQNYYHATGKSKLKFPNSKHNKEPSEALDCAPYPIDWKDITRFRSLAFFIKGIAAAKGIRIRCGIDWNGNLKADESFMDAPHIELISKIINGVEIKY